MERDSCQRQYDALYKLHQEAADNLANLSNEKQRFETFFYSVNPMRLSYFVNESIEIFLANCCIIFLAKGDIAPPLVNIKG